MKPENAALVEAKLNANGVRIVNALYADETMDTLMDAAREEGRQSAGERVAPPSEMDLGRAIWEARIRTAWPKQSAALRMAETPWPRHVADERAAEHDLALASARAVHALLSPQAAPVEQKDGAS